MMECAPWLAARLQDGSSSVIMSQACDMRDSLLSSASRELLENSRPPPAFRPSSFWSRFRTTCHSKSSATLSPLCTLVYTIWHNNWLAGITEQATSPEDASSMAAWQRQREGRRWAVGGNDYASNRWTLGTRQKTRLPSQTERTSQIERVMAFAF